MSKRLPVLALVALLSSSMAFAASGDLDPSFGSDGSVVSSTGTAASAAVLLPDGRLVIGGSTAVDLPIQDFRLTRLDPNGAVDPTFGSGGVAVTDFGGGPDAGSALLRQPDGLLVQAGTAFAAGSGTIFAAARFDADGTLDPMFGIGGRAGVDFPVSTVDRLTAVGRQSDGKLVLAGDTTHGSTRRAALARLDVDGTLDATFGTGGIVEALAPGTTSTRAFALLVLPDDRLIVAGESSDGAVLLRFDGDGALDATFGTGGAATVAADELSAIARQSDGKLVAAGTQTGVILNHVFTYPLLARYDADGALDPTFGDGGLAEMFGVVSISSSRLTSVVVASDGTIFGGGVLGTTAANQRFLLVRLSATGGPTGGTDMYGVAAATPNGSASALLQQPDTKIVATGFRIDGPNDESRAVVARYFAGICGNGVVEPDETCDDGNATSGDGCDANCKTTGCGSGIVTAGESCDDGNTADGDCCSSTCTADPAGTACADDGDVCSNDACDGSGACAHPHAPAPVCTAPAAPGKSSLQVTANNGRAKWKSAGGTATMASELGDPTTTTSYTLCLYDHAAGVPELERSSTVAGGAVSFGRPGWKATSRGFTYKDKYGQHDGILSVQLVANPTPGKSKVSFSGTVTPSVTLPFAKAPNVVVQLRNSVGGCWGASFGTAARNDAAKFSAKSD